MMTLNEMSNWTQEINVIIQENLWGVKSGNFVNVVFYFVLLSQTRVEKLTKILLVTSRSDTPNYEPFRVMKSPLQPTKFGANSIFETNTSSIHFLKMKWIRILKKFLMAPPIKEDYRCPILIFDSDFIIQAHLGASC